MKSRTLNNFTFLCYVRYQECHLPPRLTWNIKIFHDPCVTVGLGLKSLWGLWVPLQDHPWPWAWWGVELWGSRSGTRFPAPGCTLSSLCGWPPGSSCCCWWFLLLLVMNLATDADDSCYWCWWSLLLLVMTCYRCWALAILAHSAGNSCRLCW